MIDYLEQIKEAVLLYLAEEDVSIGIFGSLVVNLPHSLPDPLPAPPVVGGQAGDR